MSGGCGSGELSRQVNKVGYKQEEVYSVSKERVICVLEMRYYARCFLESYSYNTQGMKKLNVLIIDGFAGVETSLGENLIKIEQKVC